MASTPNTKGNGLGASLKRIFGGGKATAAAAPGPITSEGRGSSAPAKKPDTKSAKPQVKIAGEGFRLPIIGNYPLGTQLSILGSIIVVLLVMIAALVYIYIEQNRQASAHQTITSEMKFHTQRLAKSSEAAARGNAVAFNQLSDSRDEFDNFLKILSEGGTYANYGNITALSNEDSKNYVGELNKRWPEARSSANAIVSAKKDLTLLASNIAQIRASAEEIGVLSQELTSTMTKDGAAPAQILKASRLGLLAERLGRGAAEILGSETIDAEVTFLIGKDTTDMRDLIKAFETGSETIGVTPLSTNAQKEKLGQLKEQFARFDANATPVLQELQKLVSARQASSALSAGSEQLLSNVTKITENLQGGTSAGLITAILVLSALTLLTLGLGVYAFITEAGRQRRTAEGENKRNQEAILRLLNEMGDLADGDLTVRAKVTEDITGAIADSMNYTIDELRNLVAGVNNASQQVTDKSQEAQKISVDLLAAAERQSKEIEETSAQVLKVAESINEVSKNAEEGARVARTSLSAAETGSTAVQNSISGMNDIRTQIQETAKRIKRLGESSQEIGEIVELITDITEQTNVLALNAAIQAASAGEAGRGFSVVAEEVQRLAERSQEATKQIGAIVKTIQADTSDAVAAMERSTAGVVEGAKLSDAAGQALSEIDRVTKNLAGIINTISSATQTQAAATNQVAKNMQEILEITRQTTRGTQKTAASVNDLTRVASDLKSSVSGFKL
jgi:twitching motility protein PilJ